MPQAQNMLFALHIQAHGGDQAISAEELAVDHQHQQVLWDWPLEQTFQLFGGGSFPMPADAGTLDAIAFETTLDGPLVIPGRALPSQLTGDSLLQLALLLKGFVAAQVDFFSVAAAQTRPLQLHFAPAIDHITGLRAVPVHRLLAPGAQLLLNFGFHYLPDHRQAQLSGETFDILARLGEQLLERQLCCQRQSANTLGFFFGPSHQSAILSHWFSWLIVTSFNCPSCLVDSRRTTSNSNYRRDNSPQSSVFHSCFRTRPDNLKP